MQYSTLLRRLRSGLCKTVPFSWSIYGSSSAPFAFPRCGDTFPNTSPFCLPSLQRVNRRLSPRPFPKQLMYAHHTENLHTSTPLLKDNEKEPHNPQTIWSNVISNARMFWSGVKALYHDMRLVYKYQAKNGRLKITAVAPRVNEKGKTDIVYSRDEMQFVYRVC